MKKTVKIKLLGFWSSFKPEKYLIFQLLEQKYDVKFVDSDPDFVVCSIFGNRYEYLKYPQVRIMISGENFIPDFNYVDYAISSYPIKFYDRSFRLPFYFVDFTPRREIQEKNRKYTKDILKDKVYFANFIASHDSEFGLRGEAFKKLSEYKRVESCGTLFNNMPDGLCVKRSNNTKQEIQKKSKFTLCFESTRHEGFITEKIIDAFYNDTIPIYYGSSDVTEIFNPNAFINCSDYVSFDEIVKKVIELDNNDDLYLKMLSEPIFNDPHYYDNLISSLETFLYNIFDQDPDKAYRRSRVYSPKIYEEDLLEMCEMSNKYRKLLKSGFTRKDFICFSKIKLKKMLHKK